MIAAMLRSATRGPTPRRARRLGSSPLVIVLGVSVSAGCRAPREVSPPNGGGSATTTITTNNPPPVADVGFELRLEPHAGPWAPLDPVEPRPFAVAPQLETEVVETWTGVDSLYPRWVTPDLPGRAVGLLLSTAWWAAAPPNCRDRPPEDRVEYRFAHGKTSGYALYFPSDGRGFNFLPAWSVQLPFREIEGGQGQGGAFRIDAAMYRPDTANPWGLETCAHMVELEVNHGRGGTGIHFIATALRIVDGTERFAGSAQGVLEALSARFAADREGRRAVIDAALRQRARDLNPPPPEPLTPALLGDAPPQMVATWDHARSELDVLLFERATGELSAHRGRQTIPPVDCPPGAPCAYRESGTFDLFTVWTITAEAAARYRVDHQARLVRETHFTPRVSVHVRDDSRPAAPTNGGTIAR